MIRFSIPPFFILPFLGVVLCGLSQLSADEPAANVAQGIASQPVASQIEPLSTTIDRMIAARLPDYDKVAAPLCSDAEFLRRIFLDLAGIPPTSKQAREFLADMSPDKRVKLIDQLLGSPEFHW